MRRLPFAGSRTVSGCINYIKSQWEKRTKRETWMLFVVEWHTAERAAECLKQDGFTVELTKRHDLWNTGELKITKEDIQ